MAEILKGVRILDLSQYIAGPYGTLLLGDLGAEIIKIENPDGGDLSRNLRQYTHKEESAYYLSFNRNKKSLTLNFRNPKATDLFYDLVKVSDIVYDNFRTGMLEKFRIDYESLKKINPRIISCSVTGFGSDSPYKDRPALDLLIQAYSGVMSFTGEAGRPPVRLGIPMGDLNGAMFAVMGVLGALYYRGVTGKGQRVDIGMLDGLISLMTYRAQYCLLGKEIPEPVGSGHVSAVPIRAFQARDGKYLTIDAAQDKFFQNVCKALELPETGKDPRFSSVAARLKNRDALFEILEKRFREKDRDDWVEWNKARDAEMEKAPLAELLADQAAAEAGPLEVGYRGGLGGGVDDLGVVAARALPQDLRRGLRRQGRDGITLGGAYAGNKI